LEKKQLRLIYKLRNNKPDDLFVDCRLASCTAPSRNPCRWTSSDQAHLWIEDSHELS